MDPTLTGDRPPAGPGSSTDELPSHFTGPGRSRLRPLFDLDRDFAERVPRHERDIARRLLRVATMNVSPGLWRPDTAAPPDATAWLVVSGALLRDSRIDGHWTTELIGPQDVLQPWESFRAPQDVSTASRWQALEPVQLALLDARFAVAAARWPLLQRELVARMTRRTCMLASLLCLSRIRRLDDRLLLLFRLLTDRWGYVRPDGVHLRLTLSHETLARLVCAHRPSVSAAMGRLERAGSLRREGRRVVLPLAFAG